MLRPLSTGSSPAAQGESVPEEGKLGEEALDDKEDDEFSPTEGGFLDDDDQDDDFQVDDDKHTWSKRQCRNPHSKNKVIPPCFCTSLSFPFFILASGPFLRSRAEF
jgi:hypothetical protein